MKRLLAVFMIASTLAMAEGLEDRTCRLPPKEPEPEIPVAWTVSAQPANPNI